MSAPVLPQPYELGNNMDCIQMRNKTLIDSQDTNTTPTKNATDRMALGHDLCKL